MRQMKQINDLRQGYEVPACRVYEAQMQRGLCVSAQAIPPVEEEDAGIDGWGN